jgi:Fe-Mn family superoxide dismutase
MGQQYVNKQQTMLARVQGRTGRISDKTHEEHLKIYAGYVQKANSIQAELNELAPVLDPTNSAHAHHAYSSLRSLKVELTYAIGGITSHELFFANLGGGGGKPGDPLLSLILKSFGSWENYLRDLKATAMAARGWAWTVFEPKAKLLMNLIGDAQNTYLFWGVTPILAVDVTEHAYYLDFQSARAAYLDELLKWIDWQSVSNLLLIEGAAGLSPNGPSK